MKLSISHSQKSDQTCFFITQYCQFFLRYVWNHMLTLEGGLPRWVRAWQHGWCPIKGHKLSLNRGRYCKHWTHEKNCLVPISLRPAFFVFFVPHVSGFFGSKKHTTYEVSDLTLFQELGWSLRLAMLVFRAWHPIRQGLRAWVRSRDLCCSLVTLNFETKKGTHLDSESLKHMEFACISWILHEFHHSDMGFKWNWKEPEQHWAYLRKYFHN